MHRPHVSSALIVSLSSVIWTTATSIAAIAIGIATSTAVLVAFGAVGIVDAIGSLALSYHFHHALRHDELSDELERIAHHVVLVGLFSVGLASIAGGAFRLATSSSGESSNQGIAIAAISLVALLVLSTRKIRIAERIASPALKSDGQLSLVGATQAVVTLAGAAITRWVGWGWADSAATIVVGCVAASLAVATWKTDHKHT